MERYCEVQCGHCCTVIENNTPRWVCCIGQSMTVEYSIKTELQEDNLWNELKSEGNEMIISRDGNTMVPNFIVTLRKLKPSMYYNVFLEAMPISRERFEYTDSEWIPCGAAVGESDRRIYAHPNTPLQGAGWMTQPVAFNTVKFTSGEEEENQIILRLGQKYVLRLHVVELADQPDIQNKCAAFVFRETEFIAVTSYKSKVVETVKMDQNRS